MSQPWIWTDARCPLHAINARLLDEQGCRPDRAVVADEDATIKNLVASGIGLGLLTAAEAREAERAGELFIVRKSPVATIPLYFIYLCRRAEDPLIQAILVCVRTVWRRQITAAAPDASLEPRQRTA